MAGAASAGPLVTATLAFQLSALPPAAFPGVGTTGTATSNLSATVGAGTSFNGTFTTTIPLSAAPPLSQLQVKVTRTPPSRSRAARPRPCSRASRTSRPSAA